MPQYSAIPLILLNKIKAAHEPLIQDFQASVFGILKGRLSVRRVAETVQSFCVSFLILIILLIFRDHILPVT